MGSRDAPAVAERDATAAVAGPSPEAPDREGGVVRSVLAFGLGVGLANLLHFLFHLVQARILKPAEYSLLASLLAIVLIATVPIFALQATVAREVAAQLKDRGRREAGLVLREMTRWIARWTGWALLVGGVLAVPLALLTDVRRPLPAVATVALLIATVPIPIAWGGLQGIGRFLGLGGAQALFAVLKFSAGVALGLAGTGAAGVVFGVAVASAVSMWLAFLPLRSLWNSARGLEHREMDVVGRFAMVAVIKLGLFAALTNMDLLVARVAFEPETAGAYAATSVAAKALLIIPLAVTTVLFPHVATLRDTARERFHLLAALGVVGLIGLAATAVMFSFPEQLLEVAFGDRYLEAKPWLGPLGAAMALYAVAQVYVFHFLSLDRTYYVWVLGGIVALQGLGFALFHGDAFDLIWVQIAIAVLTLIVSEVFDHRARRVAGAQEPGAQREGAGPLP
jgi:O-antigen/teichoic acid export membrane protein